MKIKCIIVDDEHLARQLMQNYVQKLPQLELVKSCKSPLEAIEVLQNEKIDIMFLDIQMPDLTGLELLKSLPSKPIVVITTAYPEYALEGYSLDVLDYLVKPFPFERFVQAFNKANELIQLKDKAKNSELEINTSPHKEDDKDYLAVKVDYKIIKVSFSEIVFIEGFKEYVTIHTRTKKLTTLESLKRLETLLPSNKFLRIHKSYIASIKDMTALDGNMIQVGNQKLPLGKSYRKSVVEQVFQ